MTNYVRLVRLEFVLKSVEYSVRKEEKMLVTNLCLKVLKTMWEKGKMLVHN